MCAILDLFPGAMPLKEHLFNAVHNNWHSYGLILKDGNGRIQMNKVCPEPGEYNPEVIWKLLEDNKDVNRILHLRHTTKGGTSQENAQPFCVYASDSRQIYFMHNGTLHGFGSHLSNEDAVSDTREFCEKVVSPALLRWHGDNGLADYTDKEFTRLVLDKQWTMNSRGLFVSNDLPTIYYGNGWKRYQQEDPDAPAIWVSNDDYFKAIIRGPEYEKVKEEERKARLATQSTFFRGEENQNERNATVQRFGRTVECYSSTALSVDPKVAKALNNIFQDPSHGTLEGISKLAKVTYDEWIHYVKDEDEFSVACLMEVMAELLEKANKENIKLTDKIERMQKYITEHNISVKKEAA